MTLYAVVMSSKIEKAILLSYRPVKVENWQELGYYSQLDAEFWASEEAQDQTREYLFDGQIPQVFSTPQLAAAFCISINK
jgi:hypothetical protein